ncbi:MAG: pyridoxal phosphate-dependent aminotransferase [Desulfobacterales bacterium]|jgi:aspartate aminotransferase
MTLAKHIQIIIAGSSWIRKMFEEGARLKSEYGAENVYDFSLGNPNLEPPEEFRAALKHAAASSDSGVHGYMPNTGYPHVRKSVADYLCSEQKVQVTENEVIMTCGASGALNVILKAILDPGDEVITPAPFFVEYRYYVDNHGGSLKTVSTKPDFNLDIDAVSAAISEKTRAVLINSPNNPTGQVYSKESLHELGTLLTEKGKELNRTLYLIADEPYRKIVYDGHQVPSIFKSYPESIIATSYSKDISIPGERIGHLAVNPQASFKEELIGGMALANRILGFVNAPALMQRVVASIQGTSVDISTYTRKRELLCKGLEDCGYDFFRPAGAFYLFPKTPISDDVKFVQALQEELILTVPGSGFGGPGHFRIAFCVADETIINAMPGFKRVMEKFR